MEEILSELASNPDTIKELVDKYKPLVYAGAKELLGVFKDLADNKEFFKVCATASRNEFDALVEVGFSQAQAMALILHNADQLKAASSNMSASSSKSKK